MSTLLPPPRMRRISPPKVGAHSRCFSKQINQNYPHPVDKRKSLHTQAFSHTTMALGGTGEENTICVSVLPNFCRRPMKPSSSCVEANDTLISME